MSSDLLVETFSLSAGLPMGAKLPIEFGPTLLGKEDPGVLQLHAAPGAGNGLGQPTCPFHVEIDIVRSPDDERRHLQGLQLGFDGERVPVVEGREEALKVAGALLRPEMGAEIYLDAI